MKAGEKNTVTIPPAAAYGERSEELVQAIEKSQLPKEYAPEVGQQIQVQYENGATSVAVITEVAEDTVTLDENHALAGKTLIFDLELVEIS